MRLRETPPLHLSYGLNVHPGETWSDVRASIQKSALAVRNRVAPGRPFALGLRLSQAAALELSAPGRMDEFKAFLAENNLYAPLINGFPYGRFHGGAVKENVYAPDWTTDERLDYTRLLAGLLAQWLPEGMSGGISTVPGSFRPWIRGPKERREMIRRLLEMAASLERIWESSGRLIHLGLEPEPGCFLETTGETVEFFQELFAARPSARRHLGVCVDVCHLAVGFESPEEALARYEAEGIRVSRIQISSAISVHDWRQAEEALRGFDEPVYLHQVCARFPDGGLKKWTDLAGARGEWSGAEEIRAHFHTPLDWTGCGPLSSTAACLPPEFFRLLASGITEFLEMETYTFHVLPEPLRRRSLEESLAAEYRWMLERLPLLT